MTLKTNLPYLVGDTDERGNDRVYVRLQGRKVRIREQEGTPEFATAYSAALDQLRAGARRPSVKTIAGATPGTIGWLASSYFISGEYKVLAPKSQRTRRQIIEACLREPLVPKGKHVIRDCPLARFNATHVLLLRDRRADRPGAANNRLKYLSAMFGWAIGRRLAVANPVRDVEAIKYASSGFYTWTLEDLHTFEARHPVGSKARLAMGLLLFLGSRRGDMIQLGPKHMRGGLMTYVPRKTAYVRPEPSVKPILAPLAEIIAATPTGLKTFLVTELGAPFSDGGIGNKMREWCDEAGLPQCTAHGLKKLGATVCADNGAGQ